MKHAKLFTPGPTAVPTEVLEAQSRPLIHHRTRAFHDAHLEVIAGLQYAMRTQHAVVVLTASGTGAMEATVTNLTAPGEKVVVTEVGKFSERWSEIARAYGVEVVAVEAPWGESVPPEAVARAFDAHPDAKALFTTHSETSTGALQDVAAQSRVAKERGALVAVDAITSVCAHDVETDAWGLDAVVGGSQKGVMVPPGLAYLALSPAAQSRMEAPRHSVYYFDLRAAVKAAATGDSPYTPAITLVLALQRALQMIRAEGIERVIARHAANAAAVRAAVRALGLELVAKVPSNATTAVYAPEGSAPEITRRMERDHGVIIAGGQGRLKDRIVRLGHLGYYDRGDMTTMITALEAVLLELGLVERLGAGVAALDGAYAGGA
ncbi:MAG: alanine--glyoxylate aminotransferase family protein [Candidatus Krumholzibacteria bacterium]|nr:alanine--glyoxylate aminotransferase family protein [Candidatus Krumholzibacteria bacterium]